jgi:hypothetical protein
MTPEEQATVRNIADRLNPGAATPAKAPDIPGYKGRPSRPESEIYATHTRVKDAQRVSQQLFKAGQTAKKLDALNPAEKADLMKQLFGKVRSQDTWTALMHELRGLETGKVKP